MVRTERFCKNRPRIERVAHVQLEGILFAGDEHNAALGVV